MARQVGVLLGKWLYKQKIIQQEKIDDIRYAFEIIISEGIEMAVIMIYSLFINKILQTAIFLNVFHVLRAVYQEYHASTIVRCLLCDIRISSYMPLWLPEMMLMLLFLI